MTVPKTQNSKFKHSLGSPPDGRGSACSSIKLVSLIVPKLAPLSAANPSVSGRTAVRQWSATLRLQSNPAPAPLKSP
jgi:hypothetical protein